MIEEFARPAWADHHARLSDDLSRGLAGLIRLLRTHVIASVLPGRPNVTRRRDRLARRSAPVSLPADQSQTGT